jgi:hypothetical protein
MIAADFLDRLDGHQSAAYLDGAVETLAYSLAAAGENKKATCLLDWYYRGAGPSQLIGTLKAHRDLPVSGILHSMAKRLCQ